jgi:hypothetical protein
LLLEQRSRCNRTRGGLDVRKQYNLRQAIRTVAEPGDSGYITQHKPPHPSITHRFQLDTQARIRFTSTYTA